MHNPEIFVREIQTLRTLVRHFHTGAILKSHTAVHIFSYENPEITYTEGNFRKFNPLTSKG